MYHGIVSRILIANSDSPSRSQELFTPNDLEHAEKNGDFDIDANVFDLRPDTRVFTRMLKSINRSDISAQLFVELLQAYQDLHNNAAADPFRCCIQRDSEKFLYLSLQSFAPSPVHNANAEPALQGLALKHSSTA
jgi:hypothetical protein